MFSILSELANTHFPTPIYLNTSKLISMFKSKSISVTDMFIVSLYFWNNMLFISHPIFGLLTILPGLPGAPIGPGEPRNRWGKNHR